MAYPSLGSTEPACDTRLKPIQGTSGYVPRANRCEGLYVSPISAPGVELVSLLRGKIRYDLQPTARLIVQVPSSVAVGTRRIQIRAMALPLKTYYRMDASLSDSNSMLWPIGEVLFPLRLHHANLGVFGWVETPEGRLFLPLRVTSDGNTSGREPIEIVVRTTTSIERLLWRSAEEATSTRPTDWQPLKGDFSAGRLATISLPDDRSGILLVDVAGKLYGSEDWARLSLRVLRTPQ